MVASCSIRDDTFKQLVPADHEWVKWQKRCKSRGDYAEDYWRYQEEDEWFNARCV